MNEKHSHPPNKRKKTITLHLLFTKSVFYYQGRDKVDTGLNPRRKKCPEGGALEMRGGMEHLTQGTPETSITSLEGVPSAQL